jgi:hypothetical protein
MSAEPRSGPERKADTIAKFEAEGADVWVATASASGVAHLVPLSYAWDGTHLIIATEPELLTVRNIATSGRARLGFGPTRDIVIVDAELDGRIDVNEAPQTLGDLYAHQSQWDPRRQKVPFVFLLLRPNRIQAWREADELDRRMLMRDGAWLF